MTLGVIGSRSFNDYIKLKDVLDNIPDITKIVSGGAHGADTLAIQYAKEKNIPFIEYLPQWNLYGRGVGIRRNIVIIENSDKVAAFWNGESKGTKHGIDLAKDKGILLAVIS
jgi:hypothetical protein